MGKVIPLEERVQREIRRLTRIEIYLVLALGFVVGFPVGAIFALWVP